MGRPNVIDIAMRTAAVGFVALALLLSAACGSGGPKAAAPTPSFVPSTSTIPALTAREIIERSNDAMNRLQSARVTTEVRPAVAPELNASWNEVDQFVSPNRAHFVRTALPDGRLLETIVVGNDAWMRTEPDGGWISGPRAGDPVGWPQFHRLQPRTGLLDEPLPVTEPLVLREEVIGDRQAWVVSYSYQEQSEKGRFNVFITEWIEKETYLLLRDEHYDDDPLGDQARFTDEYSDFDAPITIQPPI
jgi:hypothetical protein